MGPTALLPLRRKACRGFFRPKNPTASAGCETANLGTKGQHATSTSLKLLLTELTLGIHNLYIWVKSIKPAWLTDDFQFGLRSETVPLRCKGVHLTCGTQKLPSLLQPMQQLSDCYVKIPVDITLQFAIINNNQYHIVWPVSSSCFVF